MNSKNITNGILKAVAILAGIAILLYFLYQVQAIIVYIAISAVLALIGSPIIQFLKKRLRAVFLVGTQIDFS